MTRDEKIARAVELRGEGVYLDEIATYLGVSRTTVVRWTDSDYATLNRASSLAWKDAHREQNRARDRQFREDNKTPCPWCGAPSCAEEACSDCRHERAVVRRSLIEGMWADGWTLREISGALGVDAKKRIGNWRRDGYDLPYRRTAQQVANITAGVRAAMA